MGQPTRICFVRHGETDWNLEQRMQGHRDLPLNALGEGQAKAVGRYFSGRDLAAIYSSDLQRALQTAAPIAQALNLPVIPLPALRERCLGRCEGLTFSEIFVCYEDDARAMVSRDPDYVTPGGGESRRAHEQRVVACIDDLLRRHPGEALVVVTHSQVMDVVYRRAQGLPLGVRREPPIPNGAVNWVSFDKDRWVIDLWGSGAHLF